MGREDQRATAGRLMMGSSLKGAIVSSVMYRARWTAHLIPHSPDEAVIFCDLVAIQI